MAKSKRQLVWALALGELGFDDTPASNPPAAAGGDMAPAIRPEDLTGPLLRPNTKGSGSQPEPLDHETE